MLYHLIRSDDSKPMCRGTFERHPHDILACEHKTLDSAIKKATRLSRRYREKNITFIVKPGPCPYSSKES